MKGRLFAVNVSIDIPLFCGLALFLVVVVVFIRKTAYSKILHLNEYGFVFYFAYHFAYLYLLRYRSCTTEFDAYSTEITAKQMRF